MYKRLPESEIAELEHDPERAQELFVWSPASSVPPEAIEELKAKLAHSEASERVMIESLLAATADKSRFSLDKEWHVVHFLLSGSAGIGFSEGHREDSPLHNVVLGGTPTAVDIGAYGPARALAPREVQRCVVALRDVVRLRLYENVSMETLNKADLYGAPQPGGWNSIELSTAFALIPRLLDFFEQAANAEESILSCVV